MYFNMAILLHQWFVEIKFERKFLCFPKDIETMPREQIENLQVERLKWLVDYCIKNIPFYNDRLSKAGITAEK